MTRWSARNVRMLTLISGPIYAQDSQRSYMRMKGEWGIKYQHISLQIVLTKMLTSWWSQLIRSWLMTSLKRLENYLIISLKSTFLISNFFLNDVNYECVWIRFKRVFLKDDKNMTRKWKEIEESDIQILYLDSRKTVEDILQEFARFKASLPS